MVIPTALPVAWSTTAHGGHALVFLKTEPALDLLNHRLRGRDGGVPGLPQLCDAGRFRQILVVLQTERMQPDVVVLQHGGVCETHSFSLSVSGAQRSAEQ